jgi:hypothetical protein
LAPAQKKKGFRRRRSFRSHPIRSRRRVCVL